MKLLEIQNINTNEFHNIKVNKYNVDYKKNWGNQQRNLIGSIRGSLIGLSANVTVTTPYLGQSDVELIGSLLNQPYFLANFYDTLSNTTKTASYTASDVSTELVRLASKQYTAFTFTLSAVDMWVS